MTRSLTSGKSLLDIYLERLKTLSHRTEFCGSAIAINPKEISMWYKAAKLGVDIIERSDESVKKGQPLNVIFECVKNLDADHVMWINGCQPLLKNKTILAAANKYHEDPEIRSMTAVIESRTFMWDVDGVPLNNADDANYRTDRVRSVSCATHSFHIWDREIMLETGQPWGQLSNKDPYLFAIPDKRQVMDSDTMDEFYMLSDVYGSMNEEERKAVFDV